MWQDGSWRPGGCPGGQDAVLGSCIGPYGLLEYYWTLYIGPYGSIYSLYQAIWPYILPVPGYPLSVVPSATRGGTHQRSTQCYQGRYPVSVVHPVLWHRRCVSRVLYLASTSAVLKYTSGRYRLTSTGTWVISL